MKEAPWRFCNVPIWLIWGPKKTYVVCGMFLFSMVHKIAQWRVSSDIRVYACIVGVRTCRCRGCDCTFRPRLKVVRCWRRFLCWNGMTRLLYVHIICYRCCCLAYHKCIFRCYCIRYIPRRFPFAGYTVPCTMHVGTYLVVGIRRPSGLAIRATAPTYREAWTTQQDKHV